MATPPYNPFPDEQPVTPIKIELPPAPAVADPPWSIADVLLLAALSIVAVFILGAIALGVGVHFHPYQNVTEIAKNARYLVPPQIIGYTLSFAYMVAILRSRGFPFWSGIRWRWPNRWFLFAIGGFVLAVATQVLGSHLPIPTDTPFDKYFSDTTSAYLIAVTAVFFAPLMEELFFRGFLYPALARRIGWIASVIITTLSFTLIHAQQLAEAWAPLLLIFIVGLTLTLIRVRTGSVASSFLVHFGYNFTILTAAFFTSDHFRNFEKMH